METKEQKQGELILIAHTQLELYARLGRLVSELLQEHQCSREILVNLDIRAKELERDLKNLPVENE